MDGKQMMAVKEMMDFLGISRATAYALVNEHGFPSFKIGKKVLIDKTKMLEWIDNMIAKNDENKVRHNCSQKGKLVKSTGSRSVFKKTEE